MQVHANGVHQATEATTESIDAAIRTIELGLLDDDPDFVRGWRRQARAERTTVTIVVTLLVATALLLVVGLATYSWFALVAGALAFVGASTVDAHYRRHLGRPPIHA